MTQMIPPNQSQNPTAAPPQLRGAGSVGHAAFADDMDAALNADPAGPAALAGNTDADAHAAHLDSAGLRPQPGATPTTGAAVGHRAAGLRPALKLAQAATPGNAVTDEPAETAGALDGTATHGTGEPPRLPGPAGKAQPLKPADAPLPAAPEPGQRRGEPTPPPMPAGRAPSNLSSGKMAASDAPSSDAPLLDCMETNASIPPPGPLAAPPARMPPAGRATPAADASMTAQGSAEPAPTLALIGPAEAQPVGLALHEALPGQPGSSTPPAGDGATAPSLVGVASPSTTGHGPGSATLHPTPRATPSAMDLTGSSGKPGAPQPSSPDGPPPSISPPPVAAATAPEFSISLSAAHGPQGSVEAAPTAAPSGSTHGPGLPPAEQLAPAFVALSGKAAADGPQSLVIRLDPAGLGHVQVQIERKAGGPATVHLTVERSDTLQTMLQDRPRLDHALDLAGVPSEGRSVEFTLAPPDRQAGDQPGGLGSGGGADRGGFGGQGFGAGSQDGRSSGNARPRSPPRLAWLRAGVDITA